MMRRTGTARSRETAARPYRRPHAAPSCMELALEYIEAETRELVSGAKAILNDPAVSPEYRLGAADQLLAALELYGSYAQAAQERRDDRAGDDPPDGNPLDGNLPDGHPLDEAEGSSLGEHESLPDPGKPTPATVPPPGSTTTI